MKKKVPLRNSLERGRDDIKILARGGFDVHRVVGNVSKREI